MSILNPEHLLDQAVRLVASQASGPTRQVDLRRAMSAAYYAVFHAILAAAADVVVGRIYRNSPVYALVYRSVEHKDFRTLCTTLRQGDLPQRYQPFAPIGGFGLELRAYARAALSLQERRQTADYDPARRFQSIDARLVIDMARAALGHWQAAPEAERRTLLMLLLFPPR